MFESIRSWFAPKERIDFDIPLDIEEPSLESFPQRDVATGVKSAPAKGKKIRSTGLAWFAAQSRTEWIPAQYNHSEIELVFDIEGYFASATRKKLALFSKEGWEFVGPNDQRVEYIRARIEQIERVTDLSFSSLLEQTARNLAIHSNAFWLKVRSEEASGGKVRQVGNRTIQPVAGYFSLSPANMVPKVDTRGNVVGWKIVVGSEEKVFPSDDVVHFYINRKDGYPLGIPSIIPGLGDIHALRHIEEDIEVLIRKNLFPLMLFKVGTPEMPAQVYPDGSSELDEVQARVQSLPAEGALVVPERYDVEAVGSEGRALRAEGYLSHFKERVFADLDVSSVDMGIGGTANRNTAGVMSRNLIDAVKWIQGTIENFVNLLVIAELLEESTFSEGSLPDSKNKVYLKFREIDTEAKIKKENHAANMFNNNMIGHGEAREEMSREPLTEAEQQDLHWHMLGREMALIQAVDELSPGGKPSSPAKTTSSSDSPSNQHGKRAGPKLTKDALRLLLQDAIVPDREPQEEPRQIPFNPVMYWHKLLRDEFQQRFAAGVFSFEDAKLDVMTTYELALKDFQAALRKIVRATNSYEHRGGRVYNVIEDRAARYVHRLRDDVVRRLKSLKKDESPDVVFNALEYRAKFMNITERNFARNFAVFHLAKATKRDVEIVVCSDACDLCRSKLTKIKWNDSLAEDKLPPHHVNCYCGVKLVTEE